MEDFHTVMILCILSTLMVVGRPCAMTGGNLWYSAAVDALVRVVKKDGAASDTFSETQGSVSCSEEWL